MGKFFAHSLKTEDRLTLTKKNAQRGDYLKEPLISPLQKIDYDDELEQKISDLFSKIFNEALVVYPQGGNIALCVGQRPEWTKEQDRRSREYAKKLEALPLLTEQGDGMKSVAGIILELWASAYTIFFLDEPEAFLHPPQARELGRILVSEKAADRQLFLATHSSDFIKGLLEGNKKNVHIVRIIREKNESRVKILKNEDITAMLKDSWLRYSNALDAMFYEHTVLCEADADCRFYHAILDTINEGKSIKPETLFISCGGKDKFKKVAAYMKKLGVNPKIIADIDVIVGKGKGNNVKHIYESLGGNYRDISDQHSNVLDEIHRLLIPQRKKIDSRDYKKTEFYKN